MEKPQQWLSSCTFNEPHMCLVSLRLVIIVTEWTLSGISHGFTALRNHISRTLSRNLYSKGWGRKSPNLPFRSLILPNIHFRPLDTMAGQCSWRRVADSECTEPQGSGCVPAIREISSSQNHHRGTSCKAQSQTDTSPEEMINADFWNS